MNAVYDGFHADGDIYLGPNMTDSMVNHFFAFLLPSLYSAGRNRVVRLEHLHEIRIWMACDSKLPVFPQNVQRTTWIAWQAMSYLQGGQPSLLRDIQVSAIYRPRGPMVAAMKTSCPCCQTLFLFEPTLLEDSHCTQSSHSYRYDAPERQNDCGIRFITAMGKQAFTTLTGLTFSSHCITLLACKKARVCTILLKKSLDESGVCTSKTQRWRLQICARFDLPKLNVEKSMWTHLQKVRCWIADMGS